MANLFNYSNAYLPRTCRISPVFADGPTNLVVGICIQTAIDRKLIICLVKLRKYRDFPVATKAITGSITEEGILVTIFFIILPCFSRSINAIFAT